MQAQGFVQRGCYDSRILPGNRENMKSPRAAVLLFLVLAPALTAAQRKPALISLSEYQKQEWHVEDGLPQVKLVF
jgi:hypothetical protein